MMFSERTREFFAALGENRIMCLATSENDRVTARSMSVVILNGKFYFQTDSGFLKHRQISANPRIALCYQNIGVECRCRILGHPLLPENQFFAEKFREYYQSSFESYTQKETEVLVEATPVFASVWDYDDGKPYREFLDFKAGTFRREDYV